MAGCGGGAGGGSSNVRSGDFSGSTTESATTSATVSFNVDGSGVLIGSYVLNDNTAVVHPFVILASANLSGTASPDGSFTATGAISVPGSPTTVTVSGTLPTSPQAQGTIHVQDPNGAFDGPLGIPPKGTLLFSNVSNANLPTTDFACVTHVTHPNTDLGNFFEWGADEVESTNNADHRNLHLDFTNGQKIAAGHTYDLSLTDANTPPDSVRKLELIHFTTPSVSSTWSAISGQVVVDVADGFHIKFHVVNAMMIPKTGTGSLGSFTLNGSFESQ